MRIKPLRSPPPTSATLSWRELYERGSFAQRELISGSKLGSIARERGLLVGIGRQPLEGMDQAGAFQPIAFATAGYSSGFTSPPEPTDSMVFREEQEYSDWEAYAWDAYGHPHVSELYSPWQLLYLADALDGASADLSVELLLHDAEHLQRGIDSLRILLEGQHGAWRTIDGRWRPLLKVLLRLQNRYWPEVSKRVTLLFDPERGERIDPLAAELEAFVPAKVLSELGCTVEDITEAYHYLCDRALNREPGDNLYLLRRAIPRPFQVRWRGCVRLGQDHLDAADILRRFLFDLTGDLPPDPDTIDNAYKALARRELLEHDPRLYLDRGDVKRALIAAELYPHGVHVLHEGASERALVERLVGELLWPGALDEVQFTDLKGSGAAASLGSLASAVSGYALRALLIVDREGEMGAYVAALIERETLPADDVLMFEDSLEASNFSPTELIEMAAAIGTNPPDGRERTELRLDAATLMAYHQDRRARAGQERPGLGDSLRVLARRTEHGAVNFSKTELADAMGGWLLREFDEARGADAERLSAELMARRPVLRFIVTRLIGALNRPVPIS